jgi:DNA-binding response OmpR family regulator
LRVLVVEDYRLLADAVVRGLNREGLAVDVAYDGLQASQLAAANRYDVVILDRDLPVVNGDDLCRELAGGEARIIMLTASGAIEDRVEGLELGADDYLPKPFAFPELVARVRAVCRRSSQALPPILTQGDIMLDASRHRVTRAGRELTLTPKEFGILEVLLAARGNVVSAEELLERVWDEHADPFTNSVRVMMSGLRRKLGEPPVIATVHGVGYRV